MDFLQNIGRVFSIDEAKPIHYNIPIYQRGYKWTKSSVRQLLVDVNNFEVEDGKFYCLQNITLVKNLKINGNTYNVVDGQQRLTTLAIILSFLSQTANKLADSITYSIRRETEMFLREMIYTRKLWSEEYRIHTLSFQDFCSKNDLEVYNKTDVFFIYNAAVEIEKWFLENEVDQESFLNKLLDSVKLIVNNLKNDEAEETIFSNLNTGKVALDGADLIRGIFITRIPKEKYNPTNSKSLSVEQHIKINEYRVRLGLELDEIGRWWSNPLVQDYFGMAIGNKTENPQTFKKRIYPIDYLYLLFFQLNCPENEISIYAFETKFEKKYDDYSKLYQEILKLHQTLKDWYSNRKEYHYVGYLLAFMNGKDVFAQIWELRNSPRLYVKDDFISELKNIIFNHLFSDKDEDGRIINTYSDWLNKIKTTEKDVENAYNWYDDESGMLEKILILQDIIKLAGNTRSDDNSFLQPLFFRKNKEDKEHILPQTISNEKSDEKQSQVALNSIGNIVLLNASVNRGYKNVDYGIKRGHILYNANNGEYIRPHTLSVFLKDIAKEKSEIQTNKEFLERYSRWLKEDINTNAINISLALNDFFKEIIKK